MRGLAAADNTRDYFVTDIPWDSYIVDRIDIARGPNSFLYGLGSPAGIVNASLRNAEFRNMGNVILRTGSYGKTVRFLNINDHLADANSTLVEGMTVDQLHLSLKGYQVWADALKPLLREILSEPAATDTAPPPTGDPSAKPRIP